MMKLRRIFQHSRQTQSGFTLMEMMIAITILAVLMAFSNSSIQNGIKAKMKIQDQTDEMSAVRDALRIMERDCNLAFHYRDFELELKQAVQKSSGQQQQQQPGTTPAPGATNPQASQQQATQQALQQWTAKDPTRVDPTTNFLGTTDAMRFITMNTGRMNEDQHQADFVKVAYFLTTCRKPGAGGTSSKCLARATTPLVEGDLRKDGPQSILLEGISEFKLRYIAPSKTDWVSEWDSIAGDGQSKGNYPEAIEISLTTLKGEGEKKKKISMQIVAAVHFPNNVVTNSPGQTTPTPQMPNTVSPNSQTGPNPAP